MIEALMVGLGVVASLIITIICGIALGYKIRNANDAVMMKWEGFKQGYESRRHEEKSGNDFTN